MHWRQKLNDNLMGNDGPYYLVKKLGLKLKVFIIRLLRVLEVCIESSMLKLRYLLMVVLFFSESLIPVQKGIRQGAITSPPLYNNSVLEAQSHTVTSCIYRGIEVSVLNYAHDVLNISPSVLSIEENYNILSAD